MSDYKNVKVERDGPLAIVSFNRPDTLNAIEAGIRREILQAVNEVNADDDIRVGILTGEGRAFCAGADLTEKQPDGFDVETLLNAEYKPALMAITEAPKPWISAVNGAAAGVGSAFAMNCDLTVMADNAYLYQKVRAEKCLELGLCNRVVPADKLMEEAKALGLELAGKAPLSLRYAKETVDAAMTESVGETISHEARLQKLCMNSEDAREGAIAFLKKRAPVFKGK